jgi:hypothetical protein
LINGKIAHCGCRLCGNRTKDTGEIQELDADLEVPMKLAFPAMLGVAALCLAPVLHAGTIPTSTCAPDFSSCNIYENQVSFFPAGGLGIAGDVVIKSGSNTIAVFRIFNDFVNTGGGTGLGDSGFLYSAAFYNLPAPSSYSVNAVTVPLGPELATGFNETIYNGNGTLYNIFTIAPEPSTFGFLVVGGLLLAWRSRSAQ